MDWTSGEGGRFFVDSSNHFFSGENRGKKQRGNNPDSTHAITSYQDYNKHGMKPIKSAPSKEHTENQYGILSSFVAHGSPLTTIPSLWYVSA